MKLYLRVCGSWIRSVLIFSPSAGFVCVLPEEKILASQPEWEPQQWLLFDTRIDGVHWDVSRLSERLIVLIF